MQQRILNRQQLAQFLPNAEAIKAFEQLFANVGETIPQATGEIDYQSGIAQQQAGEALMGLAVVAEQLALVLLQPMKEFSNSEYYEPPCEQQNNETYLQSVNNQNQDTYIPPLALGSLAEQNLEKRAWTPTLSLTTPGTSSFTYVTQTGSFIKLGKLVIANFHINTSAASAGTGSGELQVSGLPYASGSDMDFYTGTIGYAFGFKTLWPTALLVPSNSTNARFRSLSSSANANALGAANIGNFINVWGVAIYNTP